MPEEEAFETGLDKDVLEEETAEITSCSLELFPTGDDASGYRTRNDPSQLYERSKITERIGAIGATCEMVHVVHGRLGSPDTEDDETQPATLIILDFTFDSRKNARRIEAAEVTLHFMKRKGDEGEDPAVVRIEPAGSMELVETSQTVDTKNSFGLNIGAPPLAGFQVGAELGWEKNTGKVAHDCTRVVGARRQLGRDYGENNSASWTLLENPTEKTGVPTKMRTSILLRRQDDFPFRSIFTMKLKVDFRSSLGSAFNTVFGRRVVDDPVFFDPTRKPTKKQLSLFDVDNLASTDLRSFSNIVSRTVVDETVRHVG